MVGCNPLTVQSFQGTNYQPQSGDHVLIDIQPVHMQSQGSTLSFLADCPKSHLLGWYRNFLVYWYLKMDNQVVNSTCPKDKLGWIWRADDPLRRTLNLQMTFVSKNPLFSINQLQISRWVGPLSDNGAAIWQLNLGSDWAFLDQLESQICDNYIFLCLIQRK